MPRRSKSIPAMWLTCLIRRKQPSLSKRLPPLRPSCVPSAEPALDSASADPDADIGGGPDESTMNDHIIIEGHDGAFAAYIARPKTSPAPAVVVLQELFGVNADIRKTCDELRNKASLRSRQTCSGCRSRASTLMLPPRPTGNTAFVCTELMTVARAPRTSMTPSTQHAPS